MYRGSTLFLKSVVVLIGMTALALCIFALPPTIGSIDLGGYDPILLGMYVTAIPFLMALYQALKLLTAIDKNQAFSNGTVKAINKIKYCAASIGAMYTAGMPYIFHVANLDDAPGVVLIGLIIIGASLVVATFAAVLQKLLKSALELKSESELTV